MPSAAPPTRCQIVSRSESTIIRSMTKYPSSSGSAAEKTSSVALRSSMKYGRPRRTHQLSARTNSSSSFSATADCPPIQFLPLQWTEGILLLVQQHPDLRHILVDPLDELVYYREALLAAHPSDELHRDVLVVDVEIGPVQRVRLDRPVLSVELRVGAHRDRRGKPLAVDDEPARVHAVGRDRREGRRLHVRRREAQFTATLGAVHDRPLDPVRTVQAQ